MVKLVPPMKDFFSSAVHVAEDDQLRSNYARDLIQSSQYVAPPPSANSHPIPRRIIQYWDASNDMPEDVRECLESWTPLVRIGFHRRVFDDRAAKQFISTELGSPYTEAFDLCYHPAMRCDYFRLCYIFENGGFYIDADEMYQGINVDHLFSDNRLKVQPLCYDMKSGAMVIPEVFTSRHEHSREWIFYFNNNPIISPPGHAVVLLALQRATRILMSSTEKAEIQSTTGPGNFTASLVMHAVSQAAANEPLDFFILPDWQAISISRWPLSYRDDQRNWRLAT